ncbi:F0F1 ATP synthase subunit epsilon [Aeromicrobium sp. 636]|uniref:ATP synthase epsilon chain n=1 Tax=Aeromicrobium senzhongii TaxID=2663859 RepID=A0A8I0EUI6_9ACTN|nr:MULTISPECIES: F0F1 ATP synthase subunit epsilon [Aeromicrobium]MBC9226681.1 F0F1 ATP synthase subunit epsilon [Aeromicrobium senzhongii]MCQ3998782.1 F0F1 ATP synthase subunit epsilon [Aeromicrobium sp. 636]MTB89208.1 F0F1 ATP synthase subunit epsilon [Aeromicrobium senzhongii]QNL93527.1 F0F1 ATP synthase subunit epsilon [Aeromicrobium senzhongii]
MTLQIELVAADRIVWSGEAREVIARTAEGDIGVLSGHAPLLSLLVPGVVEIHPVDGEVVRAAVSEGFVSVAADRVSILSEDIFLADEVDESAVTAELDEARSSEDGLGVRRAEAKLRLVGKAS